MMSECQIIRSVESGVKRSPQFWPQHKDCLIFIFGHSSFIDNVARQEMGVKIQGGHTVLTI